MSGAFDSTTPKSGSEAKSKVLPTNCFSPPPTSGRSSSTLLGGIFLPFQWLPHHLNRQKLARKHSTLGIILASACIVSVLAVDAVSAQSQSLRRLDWCDVENPDTRRDGWHFYCDDPPPPEEEPEEVEATNPPRKAPPPPTASTPLKEPTAVEKLAAITAQLQELRAEAVLDPGNAEKVLAYQRFQYQVNERAGLFADTWNRSVIRNPDIDYTLRRPTNAIAGPIYNEERNKAELAALREAASTYGLFFLFEGRESCSTCAAQASILEALSLKYDVTVLGVSRDGSTLPQFPQPIPNGPQIKALGLDKTPVPALVIFDPATNTVEPIAHGAIAESQILTRIFTITKVEPGGLY